jgi:hypothetical protein
MREKYPTAALATIDVPADRWSALGRGGGELVAYVRPRDCTRVRVRPASATGKPIGEARRVNAVPRALLEGIEPAGNVIAESGPARPPRCSRTGVGSAGV